MSLPPAPPKVPEKPTAFMSPEKLSFHEKLALHKKVADSSTTSAAPSVPMRPKSGSDAGKRQRPFSSMVIAEEPESPRKRTLSEGEMETEAAVEGTKIVQSCLKIVMMSHKSATDTTPAPLSERIASLQASQTKAGM